MKKKGFFTDLEKNLIQCYVFNDCVIMENFSKKVLQEEVKLFYSFADNFEQSYTYRYKRLFKRNNKYTSL